MQRSLTEIQALCDKATAAQFGGSPTEVYEQLKAHLVFADAAREELPRLAGVLKQIAGIVADSVTYPTHTDVSVAVKDALHDAGITP
jgi:flavin reductase (DIM6/NTAB) family NADH-FMN oxidoreductase RutF